MRELLALDHPGAARAPSHVRDAAEMRQDADTRILRILWDGAGEFPRSGRGFEQWSVRPYRVGQGCDGTIVENMHLVAIHLLAIFGIDYRALYAEAYPGESLDGWPGARATALLAETELPSADSDSLQRLLHDLSDTNHRTLKELVRNRLEAHGWLNAVGPQGHAGPPPSPHPLSPPATLPA